MKSAYKIWMFYRDEFVLIRLARWIFWRVQHESNLSDDVKSIIVLLKPSPKLDKALTKEANYRAVRSQENVFDYASIRVIWKDIYGLGVKIENHINNGLSNPSDIRYLVNILYALLEHRGKWTNNHLIMNLLILRRFFSITKNEAELLRVDDLLVEYERVIWQNSYYLEESSHYLFLLGLRTYRSGATVLSRNYKTAQDFYVGVLPFYKNLTWIGDISPDVINIPAFKESNNMFEKLILDVGFMVCIVSRTYVLKISLSDSSERHGHSDKGQLVFCSSQDEVCDIGIDDLANTVFSRKEAHSNWNFGEYYGCKKSNKILILKFKNATISCASTRVEILYHLDTPQTSIICNKIRGNDMVVYKADMQKLYHKVLLSDLFENNKIILCAE